MGAFTDGILESLAPWSDESGAWQAVNAAYASIFEPVAQLVMPNGSPEDPISYRAGWENLLDVDNCPAQFLPFLSLFNGTDVPPGTPEADARAIIRAEANFSRGTLPAIIATAQRFLSGTRSVGVVERTGPNGLDPYWFQLIVRPEELNVGPTWETETDPWSAIVGTWTGGDQTFPLTAAINGVKPAGVNWTLVTTDGFTWSSAVNVWSADTFVWASNTQP